MVRVKALLGALIFLFTASAFAQAPTDDLALITQEPSNWARITYGPGTVTDRWKERVGNNQNITFASGDFTGDGYDDISCVDFDASDDAYLFVSQSPGLDKGVLWQNKLRQGTQKNFYFMPGDYNGDGISDMASFYRYYQGANPESDIKVKIVYGPAGATFTADINDWLLETELYSGFVSGKFLGTGASNDSIDDIAAISPDGLNFRIRFYKGGTGSYNAANNLTIPVDAVTWQLVALGGGAFNSNTYDDVAAVFYNTATTNYHAKVVLGPTGATVRTWNLGNSAFDAFKFGDFTGDGYADIAGVIDAGGGNRTATIFVGNSSGVLSGTQSWTLTNENTTLTQILAGNFDRQTNVIRGTVYMSNGTTGLPGVTVSAGNGFTAVTDDNGRYTITGLVNGSYTVTATRSSFTFAPASRNETINFLDVSDVNFTASNNPQVFSISGKVTQYNKSTVGLQGITITASSNAISAQGTITATTQANGTFIISNLTGGGASYQITPSGNIQGGFLPQQRSVTVHAQSVTGVNFTDSGVDSCPNDPDKTESGECGCGVPDVDTDGDGYLDCKEDCDENPFKRFEGACGCDFPRADEDINNNDIPDCQEETYTIRGKVYALVNNVQTPLDGIVVRSEAGQDTTDENGNYAINYVPITASCNLLSNLAPQNKGEITKQGGNLVQGYTFWVREWNQGLSISRAFRMNEVSTRAGLLGCSTDQLGLDDHVKHALCKFDPLAACRDVDGLSVFDFKVNGCIRGWVPAENGRCVRDNSVPSAPTNVSATDGTQNNGVEVSFDRAESAATYKIYRTLYQQEVAEYRQQLQQYKNNANNGIQDFPPTFYGIIVGETSSNKFVDETAVPGVRYTYSVKAANQFGESAFSEIDDGWRREAGIPDSQHDSDGDGVPDEQEDEDGTNKYDPGSYVLRLASPAYSKYNTYLSQTNWLELMAAGNAAVNATVTVFDNNGQVRGAPLQLSIPAQNQVDVNIHELVGQQDAYGVVRIDFNDEDEGVILKGRMTMYRSDPGQDHLPLHERTYSFAFTRELRNSTRGMTYATANSYDPQGLGNLVPNWVEIVNLDSVPRAFTVRLYDMGGNKLYDSDRARDENGNLLPPISVPALGEYDMPGGHQFGENVYLIEVIPKDGATDFFAYVVRYSSNSSVGGVETTYNFAMPIEARPGTGEKEYVPISHRAGTCWTQSNWVEVINTRERNASAKIIFKDANGANVGQSIISMKPYEQKHLNASVLLPQGMFGQASIEPTTVGSIISQSNFYYHDCEENRTQTAYSSTGRMAGEITQLGSYNTYLDMINVLQVINTTRDNVNFDFGIVSNDSYTEQAHSLTAFSSMELNLNALTDPQTAQQFLSQDAYGPLSITSNRDKKLIAETLRLREVDGKIDFVVPTGVR